MEIKMIDDVDFFGETVRRTAAALIVTCHVCGTETKIGSMVTIRDFMKKTGWSDDHHSGGFICPRCQNERINLASEGNK